METLSRTDSFDFGHCKPSIEVPAGVEQGTAAVEFPFLRADHSFDANSLQADQGRDPSSICLSFSEGDVVFVHWVHDLGWGDVTLLHTGKRGWTPINYFSPCTDAKAIPLLSAAAQFISHPKSYRIFKYEDGTVEHSFSQAAINEVVAGVRSLLDMSGTLSRESPVAQRSQAIRRHRKALLTELAYMVSVAKQHKKSTDNAVIDRLVRGCFRIVNKAVALLDVWHIEAESGTPSPVQTPEPALAFDDNNSSAATISPTRATAGGAAALTAVGADTSVGSITSATCSIAKSSFSAHTLSGAPAKRPDLRIDEVSSTLCDYLGIFVHRLSSLGSDPTASVQILTNTRHCMLACRELLVVVEAISASSTPRNKELERLKDAMFVHTRHLVHAARTLVASLNKPQDEVKRVAEDLSTVARECSRLACECAVWCHNVQKLPEDDAKDAPIVKLPASITTSPVRGTSPTHKQASIGEISSRESSHESAISRPSSIEKSSDEDDSVDLDAPPTIPLNEDSEDEVVGSLGPEGPELDEDEDARSRSTSISTTGDSYKRLSAESTEISRDLLVRSDKVVAGTLRALIAWLGETTTPDYSRYVFCVSFRLFSTPQEVAEAIIEHNATHLAVKWIESYWRPEDAPALDILRELENAFLRECINQRRTLKPRSQLVDPPVVDRNFGGDSMIDVGRLRTPSQVSVAGGPNSRRSSLNRGIGMVRRVSHDDLRIISTPWTLKFSNTSSDIGQKFLEFDPIDVAGQLYMMDWEFYSNIEPQELLDQRFSKAKRDLGMAPNVVDLVLQSNYLSAFVGETVLGANLSVKTRRNVIRMWIRVASILHDLGNYNSLVTILSTLRSSSIVRLRKVWDMISPKKMALVTSLGKLAAPDRNFADLRSEIRTRKSHCIPYVGLFLSDITLLEEGNPKTRTHNGKTLINFDRYVRICDVIARIQHHQRHSQPTISQNPQLKHWLHREMTKSHNALADDVDVQWRKSCIIEPPA